MVSKQGSINILFICGRNQWRSPTAFQMYKKMNNISVRSAGVSSKSKHQLNEDDLLWANIIIVMESKYKARILGTFRHIELVPIEDLNIPDEYKYMEPALIEEIEKGMSYIFKKYNIAAISALN